MPARGADGTAIEDELEFELVLGVATEPPVQTVQGSEESGSMP